MKRRSMMRAVQHIMGLLLLLPVYSAYGAEAVGFPPGSKLPEFTVGVADSPEVLKYLGLKNNGPFKLSDISAKMVLIDLTNSA